ncbi:MAG TPA: four helix bundle protein [Chitinophagaceae bacterium]|jgi:four helix bundle protein
MHAATENISLKKTIEFSLDIIKYAENLEDQKKFVIARQLLRAGTSIGANVHEAQNAESKLDFIHKFKLAAKEVEETKYSLVLCQNSDSYPPCEHLIGKLSEIEKIITKIISSSKK